MMPRVPPVAGLLGPIGLAATLALLIGCAAPSAMPSATAASQRMQGLYRYMADAASFVDCQTGKRVPVAQEGDNAALQSAYGAARSAPGAPVLATVEGRVLPRPRMDGVGEEPT